MACLHVVEIVTPGVVAAPVCLVNEASIGPERVRADRPSAVTEVEPAVPAGFGKNPAGEHEVMQIALRRRSESDADRHERGVKAAAPLVAEQASSRMKLCR